MKIHLILVLSFIYFISFFLKKQENINQKYKVSVIIPTYNRANLITKSINSVLSQTYKNIELLIIDDNSVDETETIVKNINDSRIKYIKLKENKGAAYARNVGIKESSGEYISFLDSDDEYHNNKLEIQLNNLLNNKSDLDFCQMRINYNQRNKGIIPELRKEKNFLKNGIMHELSYGNFIGTPMIFVKKSIIEKYLFDERLPRLQDYDLVLRMTPKIKISYTKEILIEVYLQRTSITYDSAKFKKAEEIMLNKTYEFNSSQQNNFIKMFNNNKKA